MVRKVRAASKQAAPRAAVPKTATTIATTQSGRKLDARRDTLDFRDKMYVPTLIEVPTRIELDAYRAHRIPILDQGQEGACTGFGLATVANYLLSTRKMVRDCAPVSPRMLYSMAKRYDEWPGEDYSGSSARGAMKGWHKHGVCAEEVWPYAQPTKARDHGFSADRAGDARLRPLGAYFRVNHKDLVAMHAAIAEVGILYATASVHEGWERVGRDGLIPYSTTLTGGHAFAIVAYDRNGFWIQNSWGERWGHGGFACITYDDWLQHGSDIWVARLGAPVVLHDLGTAAVAHAAGSGQSNAYSYPDLRPHIISIGNDGELKPGGNYGTSAADVASLFAKDIPNALDTLKCKHILLYAHGGLVSEETAVQRLADYRSAMLSAGIYPLTFIWHSDYWTTIKNMLQDAFSRRRPEAGLDAAKDFMLDRLDDALEPLARALTGKSAWDEMKENALRATTSSSGGARVIIRHLVKLFADRPGLKLHVVGHSAGSIFHAPLATGLSASGVKIESCTLWAPACTVTLFKEHYLPLIKSSAIRRAAIFALTDKAEQDDNCAGIYHKSLLYLVSHAFEKAFHIPLFREGEPILGMMKHLQADKDIQALVKAGKLDLVFAPNDEKVGSIKASKARAHGDFDDDEETVRATLARMLDAVAPAATKFEFHRSASSLRERRTRAAS